MVLDHRPSGDDQITDQAVDIRHYTFRTYVDLWEGIRAQVAGCRGCHPLS